MTRRVRSASCRRFAPALALVLLFAAGRPLAQEQVLAALLARASDSAAGFLGHFSEVRCTEEVTQKKLSAGGKVESQQGSTFDYLAILTSTGGDLNFNESRLARREDRRPGNLPMLVTNGFGTLLLIFHPYYQHGFRFSEMEDEVVAGRELRRVHFQHIHGLRSPAGLLLRGRLYPVEPEGTAWLDPETGAVVRISARFDRGLEDLGLKLLSSDVEYAPVSFPSHREPEWLPATATIEVQTQHQHWINVHHFTNYQLFDVNTQEAVKLPK